ncbi:hypothetical protein Pth03_44720 [Planotetraspora thailandica]|uniref:Uncharacterized protein n=1 Tax=Planotetraspora thailandica TaxID=487172 RepID=A0A8J3V264_9ACTN|nr:hypothetical protein [Planotetraspora thailandica]GII56083.1 hypothetical protein Pth03_44720 [Planotetraspora thailandica]
MEVIEWRRAGWPIETTYGFVNGVRVFRVDTTVGGFWLLSYLPTSDGWLHRNLVVGADAQAEAARLAESHLIRFLDEMRVRFVEQAAAIGNGAGQHGEPANQQVHPSVREASRA